MVEHRNHQGQTRKESLKSNFPKHGTSEMISRLGLVQPTNSASRIRIPAKDWSTEHENPENSRISGFVGPLVVKSVIDFSVHVSGSKSGVSGISGGELAAEPQRKIGLVGCMIVIIGCVLGAGIFAAPQEILTLTGNAGLTLLVWFTYGIIALVAALCFVELGCTFPVSGGDYAYLNECFGSLPGFLFQWSANIIVIPACCAVLASVVAKNLINPHLNHPEGDSASWATTFLAIMFIMFFCYINCVNAKITEKFQGWLMIVNLITITLMVCCFFAYMIMHHGIQNEASFRLELPVPPSTLHSQWKRINFQVLLVVKALYQSSFSYFGYSYVNYITEELENPFRDLSLGVCISMPIIIFLNVFVNFCYIATLPKEQIMSTTTIASDMLRAVVPHDYAPYCVWIAPTLVAVAVSGGLTSNILTCSRISYTGARNGHFPSMFKMVHIHHRTPTVSIAFMGLLACCYALVGNIPILISIATYLESTFNCLCIYGLIYMRIKKPDIPRSIKLPLILPIAYATLTTCLFVVPIVSLNEETLASTLPGLAGAIFVVCTGLPVYFLFVLRSRKWTFLQKTELQAIRFLQKLWLVLPDVVQDKDPKNRKTS